MSGVTPNRHRPPPSLGRDPLRRWQQTCTEMRKLADEVQFAEYRTMSSSKRKKHAGAVIAKFKELQMIADHVEFPDVVRDAPDRKNEANGVMRKYKEVASKLVKVGWPAEMVHRTRPRVGGVQQVQWGMQERARESHLRGKKRAEEQPRGLSDAAPAPGGQEKKKQGKKPSKREG